MKVYKKLNRSRLNDISLVGSNSHEPFNPRGVFYDPMQSPCDVEAYSKRLKTLVLCFGVVCFELTICSSGSNFGLTFPFSIPFQISILNDHSAV